MAENAVLEPTTSPLTLQQERTETALDFNALPADWRALQAHLAERELGSGFAAMTDVLGTFAENMRKVAQALADSFAALGPLLPPSNRSTISETHRCPSSST